MKLLICGTKLLRRWLSKICFGSDTIAITKNGIPEAVLLSTEAYEGLLETIEVLADQDAMSVLKKSVPGAFQTFESV